MSTVSTPALPPRVPLAQSIRGLAANRLIQTTALAWIVVNILAAMLFGGMGVIDRPLFEGQSITGQLVSANLALAEVLLLAAIIVWLTRRRTQPALAAIPLPSGNVLRYETALLLIWGVLGIFGGVALGQALDSSPIGFHLAGTLFGAHDHDLVTRQVALAWSAYNVVVYAVIPYLYIRQRHGTRGMPLRSMARQNDLIVILVVLVIESLAQLATISSAVLELDVRKLALGLPLTFVVYLAGTVLPTVIFVQGLLVPRILAITGSVPAAVVLGGVVYTAVHVSDSWTVMTSPGTTVLSLSLLLLTYFGPGLIKSLMTVRTGNAWVHAWSYHAVAPHTIIDTPLIVRIFGL